ncbi:MAG: hypothetical protein HRU31_10905 [Rhodobacteraceae bacterium]|nr:hypothetical protein [Paracoccaceae bacterium]
MAYLIWLGARMIWRARDRQAVATAQKARKLTRRARLWLDRIGGGFMIGAAALLGAKSPSPA